MHAYAGLLKNVLRGFQGATLISQIMDEKLSGYK